MDNSEIEKICDESIKKTTIDYRYNGSFFTPQLKSINHLQFGETKLLRHPLVIVLELMYREYAVLRNYFKKLVKKCFPRRAKIWCYYVDSHLVGRTTYADRDHLDDPIHHLHIEFWARTRLGQWRKLGQGFSKADGSFSIPFELRQARNWQILYTQFEIYQTTAVCFEGQKPRLTYELHHKRKLAKDSFIGMRYDLGRINLHLWEYRRDSTLPRTEIKDPDHNSPQYYSDGRKDAMYEQIIPLILIKERHLRTIKKHANKITLADIQNDYPENLTVAIEKKIPGYTRSDEWFGKRMMNGMNCGKFFPDKNTPGLYWIKYYGVCNYEHNEIYALPTVEIKFSLKDNGLPTPIEIRVTGQTNVYNKDRWQQKVFTPHSGDDWMYAKRVARVSGAFSTEVDEHYAGTHVNTEQYSIAAHRNFKLNPLACLLFPHLKEVALINHAADKVLIEGYIPSATALTEGGLHDRTKDLLGMQDWKHWEPMTILSDAHTYARAEKLFYDIVVRYVEHFFEKNLDSIKAHWHEVYCFSQDLVKHAVPVFLSDIDLDSLPPKERMLAEERFEYYAFQYAFDKHAQRAMVDGELKVISPITTANTFDQAGLQDLENIKQVCIYVIMTATYLHSWINEHQYDDLGEILYSSGGLRFGNKERGILGPESDLDISPDLETATGMLWFTNFLSRTEYGFITRNEEGDVNPIFTQMLVEKEEEFAKLGVDIHSIESRTNI